jgi:hypothetical protein
LFGTFDAQGVVVLRPWLGILPQPGVIGSTYPRNAGLMPKSGIQNTQCGI